jgi:hypothetical protein
VRLRRENAQTIALSGLDLFCCELLHQIAVSAEPGDDDAARQRLYSSPSGGKDDRLDADWRAYVEPELRELFQSSLDVVRGDLAGFPTDPAAEHQTLRIPVDHLVSWINALNQARLALAARYALTEEEMEGVPLEGDARALAVFQVHFYGMLQQYFLREIESL